MEEIQLVEPRVVQLCRKRDGTVLQDCTLYVGRSWHMGGWHLEKSKWANPYAIQKLKKVLLLNPTLIARYDALKTSQRRWMKEEYEYRERQRILSLYEQHIRQSPDLLSSLIELNGHILGCFCVDKVTRRTLEEVVCHAEVLVKLWKEYTL